MQSNIKVNLAALIWFLGAITFIFVLSWFKAFKHPLVIDIFIEIFIVIGTIAISMFLAFQYKNVMSIKGIEKVRCELVNNSQSINTYLKNTFLNTPVNEVKFLRFQKYIFERLEILKKLSSSETICDFYSMEKMEFWKRLALMDIDDYKLFLSEYANFTEAEIFISQQMEKEDKQLKNIIKVYNIR